MATHSPHPPLGLRDHVLVDGCPRCAEHAEHPLRSLDPDRVGLLWRLMVSVEREDARAYPSALDALACKQLYEIALWVERTMPALDPWRWPWGIRLHAPTVPQNAAEIDPRWLASRDVPELHGDWSDVRPSLDPGDRDDSEGG